MPGSPDPGSSADRMVPVAVVGLAALMPGARDAAEHWRNIVAGRDLITDVPASHWSGTADVGGNAFTLNVPVGLTPAVYVSRTSRIKISY